MTRTVLIFGSIAGLIVVSMFFITMPLHREGLDESTGLWIGYTSMVVALSLTYFGIKAYRDKHLKGAITFGRALQTGVMIVLVATLFYVVGWELYLVLYGQNFMQAYVDGRIQYAQTHGDSTAEVAELTERLQKMAAAYKNPLIRMSMTAVEILPVGLVIALLCAAILRKRQVLPAKR